MDRTLRGIILFTISSIVIAACATPNISSQQPAQPDDSSDEFPAAEIMNDEGGPVYIEDQWAYTTYFVRAHFKEPVMALLDGTNLITRDFGEFSPVNSQILGYLTSPIETSPANYHINLPIKPTGDYVDVDNDGEADNGVQVFQLVGSSNLFGDSYLEQLEQDLFTSVLIDPQTGEIREGMLLIYSPDDEQGFPSSAGSDGLYFTEDDIIVRLPAGYTIADLSETGKVTFDRSRVGKMTIPEAAANKSPDFSDQGILQSYNSLIDVLDERYAYTELRDLDWEAIRQEYLPRVKAAESANDFVSYYLALNDMALSIKDAHVQVSAQDFELQGAPFLILEEQTSGSIGAGLAKLSDGQFAVSFIDPEGPAAEAGWQIGTILLSVNGVAVEDYVNNLPLSSPASTGEGILLERLKYALKFPIGTEFSVSFRQPESDVISEQTFTARDGFLTESPGDDPHQSISFRDLDGGYGYIRWDSFLDWAYKISVLEKFLENNIDSPGIIIDLRGNSGGSVVLYLTMASYLFSEDNPAQVHWMDNYTYDAKVGDLVKEFSKDQEISTPKTDFYYSGAVVVLVDENSASSAEYFSQFLQTMERAVVVGKHGTDGAGGTIERATLPNGITFQFTKGRTVFAGTDEYNLEAKGVTLDERVPITIENLIAESEGRDVVLEKAIQVLSEQAAQLYAQQIYDSNWQWTQLYENKTFQEVSDPEKYKIDFETDGTLLITADCNQAIAEFEIPEASAESESDLEITIGPATLALCPDPTRGEEFLSILEKAYSIQYASGSLVINSTEGILIFQPAMD